MSALPDRGDRNGYSSIRRLPPLQMRLSSLAVWATYLVIGCMAILVVVPWWLGLPTGLGRSVAVAPAIPTADNSSAIGGPDDTDTWPAGPDRYGGWIEDSRIVSWGSSVPRELLPKHWQETARTVGTVPGATDLVVGAQFNLARRADGTVWRFGQDAPCQPASAQGTYAPKFVRISGLPSATQVAGGACHALVLAEDGSVWAWGANHTGQLGDGTRSPRRFAVRVADLDDVVAIAAGGDHSLAVRKDGTVWAWGDGTHGALGIGFDTAQYRPVQVVGLRDVVAVAAGTWHSLALTGDRNVWAWGGRIFKYPPDDSNEPPRLPAPVPGLSDVKQIAAGARHSLALRADGSVWAWGANELGQVDPGTAPDSASTPVRVEEVSEAVEISGGDYHSLALRADGTVWAWGFDGFWVADYGDLPSLLHPAVRPVPALAGATRIAAGSGLSFAILPPEARALPMPVFR